MKNCWKQNISRIQNKKVTALYGKLVMHSIAQRTGQNGSSRLLGGWGMSSSSSTHAHTPPPRTPAHTHTHTHTHTAGPLLYKWLNDDGCDAGTIVCAHSLSLQCATGKKKRPIFFRRIDPDIHLLTPFFSGLEHSERNMSNIFFFFFFPLFWLLYAQN